MSSIQLASHAKGSSVGRSILSTDSSTFFSYVAVFFYSIYRAASRIAFTEFLSISRGSILQALQIVALLSMILCLLVQRYEKSEPILMLFMGVLVLFNMRASSSLVFVWLILFVMVSQGASIEGLAKLLLCIDIGAVIIAFIGYSISPSLVPVIESSSASGAVYRVALGFLHPNSLGAYLFGICLNAAVLCDFKRPLLVSLLCTVCAYICLEVAYSRSSFWMIAALAVIVLFHGSISRIGERRIALASFALVVAVIAASYYLMVSYSPDDTLMRNVNAALSGRAALGNYYFRTYPLSLFGNDFSTAGSLMASDIHESFTVDNVYMNLVLQSGVVPTAVLLFGVLALYVRSIRSGVFGIGMFVLTFYMVYGLSETLAFTINHNYALMLVGSLIFAHSKEKSKYLSRQNR